ncbi:MAG: class I SAM-dependent RNA methyltransferase [Pseudomonadota bacterium]
MTGPSQPRFELFASCPPGLEPWLLEEVRANGWSRAETTPGGVIWQGTWADVWRANLLLRGASRILIRLGTFRAQHLGELETKLKDLPLAWILEPGTPFRVDATCKRSKIYHSGAAEERLSNAAQAFGGVPSSEGLSLLLRIENNKCVVSADTSGALLHKRGFKQEVAGAPLRETTAALLLRAAEHQPDEPVIDPMCGSGTFVIEAAEIASGLAPGRARTFAFEHFASFEPEAYARIKARALNKLSREADVPSYGSDRAPGAVSASTANAERAGVAGATHFTQMTVSEAKPPPGKTGLVITNPPYGARLGDPGDLRALYASFGAVMTERFQGWRVALLTADPKLAQATRVKWDQPGPPFPHGGLKVRLWQTKIP